MKTFNIYTLGCKVNQYESQQVRQLIEDFGLEHAEPTQKPDLFIVNTCCVTHTASAKSRQYIKKANKINPTAPVIVAGCLPRINNGEFDIHSENIIIAENNRVFTDILKNLIDKHSLKESNNNKITTVKSIRAKNCSKIKHKNFTNQPQLSNLTLFKGQTRAFLKVQDGCDSFCSYCIIPKTRPIVQYKPLNQVLDEAQTLVKTGHKEIVVTGIFLGAYGRNSVKKAASQSNDRDKLAELLEKLAQIPNLHRIRLSSLEPADVSKSLLNVMAQNPNIMPHLHLSLQSGSERILKRMRRRYSVEEFREKVDFINARLDRPAITTDIIVGFPGETDDDFQQTVELAKIAGFSKIHVFTFSPRKGTAAEKMDDKIDPRIAKKRSEILHKVGGELAFQFRQQFTGKTEDVLIEKANPDYAEGHCKRYFIAHIKNSGFLKNNDLVKIKILQNQESIVTSEIKT
jgi:threonylcarbamoyladenosine tRNA methylthiotransferase MtaB